MTVRRDDTGSLAIALLITLAGVGLSVALLTNVVQMVGATKDEESRTAALQGARAGLNSALSGIRGAGDPLTGIGDTSELPCATADLTGMAPGAWPKTVSGFLADKIKYDVSVTYLSQDPETHDEAWVAANGKACVQATDPVPAYAYLRATGTDTRLGQIRVLYGIYEFSRPGAVNAPGGPIRIWLNAGDKNELCLDAGSFPSSAGTTLRMQKCDTTGSKKAQQKFVYRVDLTIQLYNDTEPDPAKLLCVDGGNPQALDARLKLQQCGPRTKAQQVWSFNWASGLYGANACTGTRASGCGNGAKMNNYCWRVEDADTVGSYVVLNNTAGGLGSPKCNGNAPGGIPNNSQSWNPDGDAGPGAAILLGSSQLVNYEELGRCLDVTYNDVSQPYMVVFQCKQSPVPDLGKNWNQIWFTPLPGTRGAIYVQDTEHDNNFYCLTIPSGGSPRLVTVKRCVPAMASANQIWWMRGNATVAEDEQYRIEGVGTWANLCLASLLSEPAWQQANKAGLQTCNGTKVQKWNGSPPSPPSGLVMVGER